MKETLQSINKRPIAKCATCPAFQAPREDGYKGMCRIFPESYGRVYDVSMVETTDFCMWHPDNKQYMPYAIEDVT